MIRNPVSLAPLAALALACAGQGLRPTVKLPLLAGKPLDVAAEDLAGHPVRIDGGKGQVLVVDFFASWCQPCKVQLPHLDRLSRELHAEGLEVYGVSFDEDLNAIRGFAAEMAVGFPVLWDRGGNKLAPALSIERLPTTLVVDRAGIIRKVHLGYDTKEGERLEAEVRALLAEPVPQAAATGGVTPSAGAAPP